MIDGETVTVHSWSVMASLLCSANQYALASLLRAVSVRRWSGPCTSPCATLGDRGMWPATASARCEPAAVGAERDTGSAKRRSS
jgi:hypothetical protein